MKLKFCNIKFEKCKSRLVFINCKINSEIVTCLIDSGAENSCANINSSFLKNSKIFPSNKKIQGADGKLLDAGKQTDVNLDIGDNVIHKISHVQLINNLSYDFIIGGDVIGCVNFF